MSYCTDDCSQFTMLFSSSEKKSELCCIQKNAVLSKVSVKRKNVFHEILGGIVLGWEWASGCSYSAVQCGSGLVDFFFTSASS